MILDLQQAVVVPQPDETVSWFEVTIEPDPIQKHTHLAAWTRLTRYFEVPRRCFSAHEPSSNGVKIVRSLNKPPLICSTIN